MSVSAQDGQDASDADDISSDDFLDMTGWSYRDDEPQSVLVEAKPGFSQDLSVSNATRFFWESSGQLPALELLAKRVALVRTVYAGRHDYGSIGSAIAFGPDCSYFLTVAHVLTPTEFVENQDEWFEPEWEPYPPRFSTSASIFLRGGSDKSESQCRIVVEPQPEQPVHRLLGDQAVVFSCLDKRGQRVSAIRDPKADALTKRECEQPLPLPDKSIVDEPEVDNVFCAIVGFPSRREKKNSEWRENSALCPEGDCLPALTKVATLNCPTRLARYRGPSYNAERLQLGDSDLVLGGRCQSWPGNSGGPLACMSSFSSNLEIMGLSQGGLCNKPEPSELEEGCLAPWYGMDVPDRFIFSRREAESKNPAAMALFVPVIREQIREIEQRKEGE